MGTVGELQMEVEREKKGEKEKKKKREQGVEISVELSVDNLFSLQFRLFSASVINYSSQIVESDLSWQIELRE